MAVEERGPYVPARDLMGDLRAAPLPEGTEAEAIFMMVKLNDGNWCVRSIGDTYNRGEFHLELMGFTHAVTLASAGEWSEDPDEVV